MDILNPRTLKQRSAQTLAAAKMPRKLLFMYLVASMLLSVALTLADLLLSHAIGSTSGLSGLGTRSVLSTMQTVLPFISLLAMMCWDLGYRSAMLRISRGAHTDEKTLVGGFSLFGPALRSALIQGMLYAAAIIVCSNIGSAIFALSPLSDDFSDLITPMLTQTTALSDELLFGEETMLALVDSMLPALVIILVLFAIVAVPLSYRLRMVDFALIDDPRAGALSAIRKSRTMMRGNCKALFRLDLHFWYYYLLSVLAGLLCNGDTLLAAFGVTLPINATLAGFLFYALYFAATFAVQLPLRNRVEQVYALAYDELRPKPRETQGVVLGNIFDLASQQKRSEP